MFRYIISKFDSHILFPGVGGHSLYRGSVTSVCVACHTQIVVTADIIVVNDVDRYFKHRLTVNVTPRVSIMTR